MNRFSFWQRWLLVVSVIVAVFGIALALLSNTPLFDWMNQLINQAIWGTTTLPAEASVFQQWVYAVLGATVAGSGVFVFFIARQPFSQRERWAWNCLVAVLIVWYPIDTLASLYFKVAFNALFNTGLLLLVALPLFFTRKQFVQQASDSARNME
jgi:hypothetical protein